MNIAVISFQDVCVDEGMLELINKYGKDKELRVLLPVTGSENHFAESVMEICKDHSIKVTCFIANAMDIDHILLNADDIVITDNPVKEVVRQVTAEDTLGIVWDGSPQAHFILNAVEDFGIEIWDITEGLEPIDVEFTDSQEDVYKAMMDSMAIFVEHMADYIMTSVLDVLAETVAKRIDDDDKDIMPFKEDDL